MLHPTLVTYLIMGKEVAPTTQTLHIQGYLELTKKMVGNALRKKMPVGVCLIASVGNSKTNITYCSKDGNSQAWGDPAVQGARKDLAQMKAMIEDGASELELANANFGSWLRYSATMKRYRTIVMSEQRTWMPEIHIYWGITGAGKTRKIIDAHDLKDIWIWNGNHKFYQGYDMQPIVVFDDFYGEISLPYMLKLCDRYPMIVNIKNGEANWQPKKIYFTSNVDPRSWEGWIEKPQAVKDAFFRRVREKGSITHFEGVFCGLNLTEE